MMLDVLEKRDQKSATGILAAAALASAPNVLGDEPAVAKEYKVEATELLTEIRRRLKIDESDKSPNATRSISEFLTKQLEQTILGGADTSKILGRAGQSGRLPPAMYIVEQPKQFGDMFYNLGVRRNHVDDAVKHPDDYQHLMTDYGSDKERVVSLFIKEVRSARKGGSHWLLVQCYRKGILQIAQSAWRIFPDSIDLTGAYEPLQVLKAFVAVFGLPVRVGGVEALFIESVLYPKSEKLTWAFQGASADGFASLSYVTTQDPNVLEVGIGYSINLPKYRDYLAKHSVK